MFAIESVTHYSRAIHALPTRYFAALTRKLKVPSTTCPSFDMAFHVTLYAPFAIGFTSFATSGASFVVSRVRGASAIAAPASVTSVIFDTGACVGSDRYRRMASGEAVSTVSAAGDERSEGTGHGIDRVMEKAGPQKNVLPVRRQRNRSFLPSLV